MRKRNHRKKMQNREGERIKESEDEDLERKNVGEREKKAVKEIGAGERRRR